MVYTGYGGWHVTAAIPVKFSTAHDRSRPEVGSGYPIEVHGSRGVSQPSLVSVTSDQNITPLRSFQGQYYFFLLTDRRLEQYLQNGSEDKILLK